MKNKKSDYHLHFVGIGGIGMSGIAEVLHNQGYQVSGSDLSDSETTKNLSQNGIKIFQGHEASQIEGVDVVVTSTAVKADNPEVVAARSRGILVVRRIEMLAEIMRGKTGIAVAGTHGKTTTTSMIASILTAAKLDPTVVIGGKVDAMGGNAKLGEGKYVVAEADESDGSFLHLPATYGVITNIDGDHLDHWGTIENLEKGFQDFVGKLPFFGFAAVCADDPGVKKLLPIFRKSVVTYGMDPEHDYSADVIEVGHEFTRFHVLKNEKGVSKNLGEVKLGVPGKHYLLNSLAAIALADYLEVPFETIAAGLSEHIQVKRRFDVVWKDEVKNQVIVDDYAHHPTEIRATLSTTRQYWDGRVLAVFQPHRYTRTQHCQEEFLSCFAEADFVLVTDIYPGGEEPIAGVSSESLVSEMRSWARPGQEIHYAGDLDDAAKTVGKLIQEGDMVICLGAGSITTLPGKIIETLGGAPS